MQRHIEKKKKDISQNSESWLEEHPWIRHIRSSKESGNQHSSLNNEIMDSKGNIGVVFESRVCCHLNNKYDEI